MKLTVNFESITLGQSIIKYEVPLEVFVGINELYETKKKHLPNANKQLAGKIPDEVSLFFSGPTTEKMHAHSYVSEDILRWFYSIFEHYLKWTKTRKSNMNINSIWVNEMKAGDYNPAHIHQGSIYTGLSSVMILKLPKDMGPEIARPDEPMNGQFVRSDYAPKVKIGDFYVFPYDVRHVVYPFANKKEKRRTLVCNCDVDYDPVNSRTTQ